MSHSNKRTNGAQFFAPERPPKPKNLSVEDSEPFYITTVPVQRQPDIPPKLKGILKNGTNRNSSNQRNRSMSTPSFKHPFTHEEHRPLKSEDIGHFDLKIEESESVPTKEENVSTVSLGSPRVKRKPTKTKQSGASKKSVKKNKLLDFQLSDDLRSQAVFAARIESVAGIMHLIVILMSIITLIVLAKLTSIWEVHFRRCPMYVETSQHSRVYWGNEKLVACHYAAYMPALTLIMSFSLITLHGGVLYSWRNGTETSVLLLSTTYAKVLFVIEFIEMIIAISVAGVIIDGVRQTCLSFQLNPWTEERPDHCKEGYQERDDVYGISKTYSRLMTGMVTSGISVIMLMATSVLYLIRINPCCVRR